MKKKTNNSLSKIEKAFDKYIIMPITRLIVRITERFGNKGKFLETWLSKTNTLLFISLFLAITMFIVIDQKILVYSDNSAEILRNQKINVIYNSESYVVEGLPETVDITLIGSNADLYIAKQAPAGEVTVDLSNLKAGQHRVELKYNQASTSIEYRVNPSVVTVYIYPKVSDTRTVTIDLLNQDSLNSKLIVDNVTLDTDKVVIKGADYQIKKAATVKALVDVTNIAKQEVGTYTLKDVELKAYDTDGNAVDVEVVPSTIEATINITSPSKTVPVRIIPTGSVAFGQAISSITQSVSEVTVYGTNDVLSSLQYIPIEISVEGIKSKTEYKVEIERPSGIRSMSANTVTAVVNLDKVSEKTIDGIKIDVRGLADGYRAQGLTSNDTSVSVTVKGVSSVIDSITADDITAYVDLTGLDAGEHKGVNVQVSGSDVRVEYTAKTKTVDINIFK
ncbi:MAG: hypothetical protein IJ565_01075 [Bacilli bacterium]|nr:hypothetical protein [Bacilli bacterium]